MEMNELMIMNEGRKEWNGRNGMEWNGRTDGRTDGRTNE